MNTISSSISLNQTPPIEEVKEESDVAIPLLGGDMDPEEVKANFNAMLYLLTEQMAVQMKVVDLLVEKKVITTEEVTDKILKVTEEKESLTYIYNEIFQRFIGYYSAVRKMFADGKVFKMEPIEDLGDTDETNS